MTKKDRELRVKDLVVRDVITVHADDSLGEALHLLAENRISAMPVVDGRNRCKGIVSTTDLVRVLREVVEGPDQATGGESSSSALAGHQVAEVMTADVMTVSLEDSVLTAAQEMVRSRVHRLAVVNSDNRVLGIVSTLDLLEALSREQ